MNKFEEGALPEENPAAEGDPDVITAEEIAEIDRRIKELAAEKNLEDLTPEELEKMGIKKEVGERGEIRFDLGYSPDTGQSHKQLNIRVKTEKKILTPEDEAALEVAQKKIQEQYERMQAEGWHLPGRDEVEGGHEAGGHGGGHEGEHEDGDEGGHGGGHETVN